MEYGGEGESQAIIRTFLAGCPRYWQLNRQYVVEDDGTICPTGCSDLSFLSHNALEALKSCRHPWWLLLGLNVAPDLLEHIETVLAAHKVKLEDWLNPAFSSDIHMFTCNAMWPACDIPRRSVDAFWLTARPETMRRALGGLSGSQILGLQGCPAEAVGALVDRRGHVILTEEPLFPIANLWNAYSPFYEIEPFKVATFADLWKATQDIRRIQPLGIVP